MKKRKIEKLLGSTICAVSKKLLGIDLTEIQIKNQSFILANREIVSTYGDVNITLIYSFSDDLYHYIVDTMNGGEKPQKGEEYLFLNEYVNITCGRAISAITDKLGGYSRLTIPRYIGKGENSPELLSIKKEDESVFQYRTDQGDLQISVMYLMKQ